MFEKKEAPGQVVVTNCVYNCLREKCPKWVVLTNIVEKEDGEKKEVHHGRCADAWLPVLLVEIKEMVKKQCHT